jgi:predicted SAM-dependent methyltransferase
MGNTWINLGCGYRKLDKFINIDSRPETNPDMVLDVIEGLPFEDETVDLVAAVDFLEHIPIGKVVPVIEDIYRVLKMGGSFISVTPSTDGRGAFQDPTHVSFWNKNSWLYYMDDMYRSLYGIKAKFVGTVEDVNTDDHVIHTHARLVKC